LFREVVVRGAHYRELLHFSTIRVDFYDVFDASLSASRRAQRFIVRPIADYLT
jgi:hypothetical protein